MHKIQHGYIKVIKYVTLHNLYIHVLHLLHIKSLRGLNMKRNLFKTIFTAFLICSLFIGTAMAADDEEYTISNHVKADSFMQKQVNNMDPAIQPYAQFVADNIVSIFILFIGAFIFYDAIMARISKSKGKTKDSAEHKHSQWETFSMAMVAIILFGIFAAVVQSKTFGLV